MAWCRQATSLNLKQCWHSPLSHYDDVIMSAIASQITSLTIVYSIVYSDADQRKHQSSASLAFVWGIHRGPVNSPHKWPVTRKMFSFDDVMMQHMASLGHNELCHNSNIHLPYSTSTHTKRVKILTILPRFKLSQLKHDTKSIICFSVSWFVLTCCQNFSVNLSRWLSGIQGSFCVCAQPLRDDVAMYRPVSLAGHIH